VRTQNKMPTKRTRVEAPGRAARDEADRLRRIGSDYAALRPDDYDTSVANDPAGADPNAARQRRQEYAEAMGRFADDLARSGGDPDKLAPEHGSYIGLLAEQERRFGNRRIARSVSLASCHDALDLRMTTDALRQYLSGYVAPAGYARKEPGDRRPRTVCLLLSDLHLGSDLRRRDEPVQYGPVEEARRLEYVVRQALDYKPQYRQDSELLLMLDGDLIEGYLLHDLRTGAPLVEQKVVFWKYFQAILALVSEHFPRVRVVCQPGNHGRDRVRHPGRATSDKWDGHEWELYFGLREMCTRLKNVEWDIPQRAVAVVDLYGAKLLMTHGDTEIALKHPDSGADVNARTIDRINADRTYGCEFAAAAFGHFHTPRYVPKSPTRMIFNGALVPPTGWYRTKGFVGEPCGQWLWEAVEGHAVGDLRFVEVGEEQDKDERLGTLIKPFRFDP
jgi:hypothetical protein